MPIPLPKKLAQPAQRALAGANITHLEQLTELCEADLAKLHGIGTNALRQLREAMQENNLALRDA